MPMLPRLPHCLYAGAILLTALTACTTSAPPSPPTPDPPPSKTDTALTAAPTAQIGDIRVIHTIDWPAPWGHFLIGVDADARTALIRLEHRGDPPRFAHEIVDLDRGARYKRWEARPEQAKKMIDGGYPTFRPLTSSFPRDLARYAQWLADVGPWSHCEASPPLGVQVAPNGEHIVYARRPDGRRDGDWLMLANARGETLRRLGPTLRASYAPNFSPDGAHIAFIGGSAAFARPGKQVGYVLHIADVRGDDLVAIPKVRGELRTPIWSADGATIWALGQHRNARCVWEIGVADRSATPILCHNGPIDLSLNPSTSALAILLGDKEVGRTRQLALWNVAAGRVIQRMEVADVQGMGRFGIWLDDTRMALFTREGAGLTIVAPAEGDVLDEVSLEVSPNGSILGRHGASLVGDEIIMLRHSGAGTDPVEVIGVTVTHFVQGAGMGR